MALSGSTPAPSWEEDECLDYYGMLSLHRMFEVVGGQLTERELDLLAFLLDEAPGAAGGLSNARSGLELLLELERRGQCDESNLRLLGQLLRVLARHDLLPHLARKRRRPVSPERYNYGTSSSSTKRTEGSCRRRRQSSSSSDVQQDQWETGESSWVGVRIASLSLLNPDELPPSWPIKKVAQGVILSHFCFVYSLFLQKHMSRSNIWSCF
uniref:DNA-binding death effector domain-containing protein 2 n=1 Tax=Desmodus rotundus TaxID=9430 RepID=K9IGL1_DESRO